MSQCERIIKFMRKHGSITQNDAYEHIGCVRLPARIHDLKKLGYSIQTKMEKGKNRHNEPIYYARYSLCE